MLRFFGRQGKDEPHAEERPRSEEFSKVLIDRADPGHRAQLLREVRSCPTCAYRVINPMTDRCPRCFSDVPPSDHTDCGSCDHQGSCELAKLAGPDRSDRPGL